MSKVFTILCDNNTNHAKAFTYDKVFDFRIKLAGKKGIWLEGPDAAMKKDLTKNELLVEDKHLL